MFENEHEYLVHLICCAIHNKQPLEKPDTISFEKVFEAGKAHEVANIAFVSVERLQHKPETELYKKWKIQYAFSIQRNINQLSARDTIVEAFKKNGIRNIELQGTVIKKLYPYEFWRNMSDIDFVIDKQNLIKAERVMHELGYTTKIYGDYDISAYTNPKIAVELHSDFFDPNTEFYGKMTNPFKKAELSSDGTSYKASISDIFLYNILHCIKHYRGGGAGIRRILDVYLLNKMLLTMIDRQKIYAFLSAMGCKNDYDDLSAISEEWFGEKGEKTNLVHIKNKIYMAGTHGSFHVSIVNEYDDSDNKAFFKIKKFLSLLFPTKANIYSAYTFCSRYKLPIFICWVYRWLCLLFVKNKRKHAIKTVGNIKRIKLK